MKLLRIFFIVFSIFCANAKSSNIEINKNLNNDIQKNRKITLKEVIIDSVKIGTLPSLFLAGTLTILTSDSDIIKDFVVYFLLSELTFVGSTVEQYYEYSL